MMVGMMNDEEIGRRIEAGDQARVEREAGKWTDAAGAAAILGRSRSAVYDMVDRQILRKHRVGSSTLFWRAEVEEIRRSLDRIATRRAARRESVRD